MPDQLHEDIERLRPVIERTAAEIAKDRELRSKRRLLWVIAVVLILAASFAGYLFRDAQSRCDAANTSRSYTREGVQGTLTRLARADDGTIDDGEKALIRANERGLIEDIPPRDC
jgi:hypothetical protein